MLVFLLGLLGLLNFNELERSGIMSTVSIGCRLGSGTTIDSLPSETVSSILEDLKDLFRHPFTREFHICRRWRRIALNSPELWGKVYEGSNQPPKSLAPLMELSLQRSKKRGADVKICWETEWEDAQRRIPFHYAQTATMISAYSTKIRSLDLHVGDIATFASFLPAWHRRPSAHAT